MTDYSYQLYSSRKFGPLTETLTMLRDLGYRQVEGYGALFRDTATLSTLRGALDDLGLTMPMGHFDLAHIQEAPDQVIQIARDLGLTTVVAPHTQEQDRDAAGWAAFGAQLAAAGRPLREAGLTFGWHNHAFEFADLGGADKPLDLILGACEDLLLEFDIAWAVVAGEDPLAWMETYADRLVSAHIKDIAPTGQAMDEDGWADVGQGTLDWPALIGALEQTRCRVFVMEHDNPSDDRRFATRSLAAMRAL